MTMDESGKKDILDLIKNLIMSNIPGASEDKKQGGMPSVIGVKFVVAGGNSSNPDFSSLSDLPKLKKRQLPLELFEDETSYSIQTELPGSCSEFTLEYSDGKLHLKTGHDGEYSAEIPLSPIVTEKTESHLNNGVLEIICYKQTA